MQTDTKRPLVQLFTDLIGEMTGLFHTELRLIRVEFSEIINRLASGGVLLGGGAICLIAGLVLFLLALAEWLTVAGMTREWALSLVAVGGLLIGAILAFSGVRNIKSTDLVPARTLNQVRADLDTIKEHVS